MRATTIQAPFDIRFGDVPDPTVLRPTDAVVRVTASCVCGSDLWRYRGESSFTPGDRIGHEFVGIVEAVGESVATVAVGDFVITPFTWGDNTCRNCRNGINTSCDNGGWYGAEDRDGLLVDGGQGELVRVPLADGTLVSTPSVPREDQVADLLALSDVMGTGWHCAKGAAVTPGDTVAVIGDGAVGLSAVLAAQLMGAAGSSSCPGTRAARSSQPSGAQRTSSRSVARRARRTCSPSPTVSASTRRSSASARMPRCRPRSR